ncbi:type II toxin-antitoxin system VapC family toxin [Methylocystis hirsuta]|uniref:Type II toxin-antitoxin system VapC family toxin n=1 Tax=Methylocystis hirsuta TaxID=369798 RepID=A0A3M9XR18_9HYPH|nr:type II toxin-antitoxin system VapC family toxin [Methylocystis hirsuta]RNJ50673.1 type II toxin-antitoxin system VapC family toxin [Methylocystis hirsuta]
MRLLLDTHIILGAAIAPARLSQKAKALLGNNDNELVFSVASLWEIMIKRSLNRDDFHVDPRALRRGLQDNGYHELPVLGRHALATDALPLIHKDPFDRLLIAQAVVEGLTLLTADALLATYPGPVEKI